MPRFRYRGYKTSGEQVENTVTASSRQSALNDLERMGLMVTSLRPVLVARRSTRVVTGKAFYRFNQEMIALVRAGIPLVEAIEMCWPRPDNKVFSDILERTRQEVSEGKAYSEVCQEFPEAFDSIYVAAVRTGEQTGDLKESLLQYQNYLFRKQKIVAELKQALYYPVFLLVALFIVLTILFIFVIPSFSELYQSFGAQLPMATKIVLGIADITPLLLIVSVLISVVGVIVWKSIDKPAALLVWLDKWGNRVPLIGNIRVLLQQSRIMRMLSGLLATGTPLVAALRISATSFSGTEAGATMAFVAKEVEAGKRFSDSMAYNGGFSIQIIKMLGTGENSGALPDMMEEISTYLEETLDNRLKQISTLFEPALMLVLGLLVGIVIVSMYLPIFFLAEVVQ